MTAEEEFEWKSEFQYLLDRKILSRDELAYLFNQIQSIINRSCSHQQEKIDDWKRAWHLEMANASKCEERIKELEDINTKLSEALGTAIEDFSEAEQEIGRIIEGINAALSHNLPYLAEKVLKELLKEQP